MMMARMVRWCHTCKDFYLVISQSQFPSDLNNDERKRTDYQRRAVTEWLRCEECRTKEFIELVPEKPDIWYNRWPPHTWLPSRTFLLYHAPWQVHFTISIFIRLSALNCWCWWHLIWQVSPNMKTSFKNSSTPAWYLSSNWRWCYCQWSRWWPRPQPRRRRWRWCIWWW